MPKWKCIFIHTWIFVVANVENTLPSAIDFASVKSFRWYGFTIRATRRTLISAKIANEKKNLCKTDKKRTELVNEYEAQFWNGDVHKENAENRRIHSYKWGTNYLSTPKSIR